MYSYVCLCNVKYSSFLYRIALEYCFILYNVILKYLCNSLYCHITVLHSKTNYFIILYFEKVYCTLYNIILFDYTLKYFIAINIRLLYCSVHNITIIIYITLMHNTLMAYCNVRYIDILHYITRYSTDLIKAAIYYLQPYFILHCDTLYCRLKYFIFNNILN